MEVIFGEIITNLNSFGFKRQKPISKKLKQIKGKGNWAIWGVGCLLQLSRNSCPVYVHLLPSFLWLHAHITPCATALYFIAIEGYCISRPANTILWKASAWSGLGHVPISGPITVTHGAGNVV